MLARHRKKEKRFGPSPANNYTSGSGKRGLFGFRRRNRADTMTADPNALPLHTTPADVRQSHATDTTYAAEDGLSHHKAGEPDYGMHGTNGVNGVNGATMPAGNYRY